MSERKKKDVYLPNWLFVFGNIMLMIGLVLVIMAYKNGYMFILYAMIPNVIGVLAIFCWNNQWITMTDDDNFIYSTMFGNKKEYRFSDIVSLKNNTDSITLIMKEGKVHIESCAKRSDRFNKALEKHLNGKYSDIDVSEEADEEEFREYQSQSKKSFDEVIRKMKQDKKEMMSGMSKGVLLGFALFAVGIAATLMGYFSAGPGETYSVYTGAIVAGTLLTIIGAVRYMMALRNIEKYEKKVWAERLGYEPTVTDDEYVQYLEMTHRTSEKIKAALVIILVILSLAITCYIFYCVMGHHPIIPEKF